MVLPPPGRNLSYQPRRHGLEMTVYFQSFGLEYPILQAVFFALSVIAMFVQSRIYQGAFVALALLYEVSHRAILNDCPRVASVIAASMKMPGAI
jgi:hypothetical protein